MNDKRILFFIIIIIIIDRVIQEYNKRFKKERKIEIQSHSSIVWYEKFCKANDAITV